MSDFPIKLWLDDERSPPDSSWVWHKTVSAAQKSLGCRGYDLISLDHDLGDPVDTGYTLLCWIEAAIVNRRWTSYPKIQIHTANPPAREKMKLAVGKMESLLGESLSPT